MYSVIRIMSGRCLEESMLLVFTLLYIIYIMGKPINWHMLINKQNK